MFRKRLKVCLFGKAALKQISVLKRACEPAFIKQGRVTEIGFGLFAEVNCCALIYELH